MVEAGKMQVTILGCGTSVGVPTIGCDCSVCCSKNERNTRTRSSILITNLKTKENIVVDTTPDFRSHMLRHNVKELNQILYTHTHADHCHGFDDIRAFYFAKKIPIDCWLRAEHLEEFKVRFRYAFEETGYPGVKPQVNLKEIPDREFTAGGFSIDPIVLPHGHMQVVGFRLGDFAYVTDFKKFGTAEIAKWKGKIQTMVASGLRFRDHPTHSSISETIELFQALEVTKGYITHLSHEVDYGRDSAKLPKNIEFAYDGLEILA